MIYINIKKHILPEDGFSVNKIIKNGSQIKLDKLKLDPVLMIAINPFPLKNI